jgi:hypothetical protein
MPSYGSSGHSLKQERAPMDAKRGHRATVAMKSHNAIHVPPSHMKGISGVSTENSASDRQSDASMDKGATSGAPAKLYP